MRDEEYHDLSRCPRHAYVAFYLWLRARGTDALVHVGAHGTLEWLPGKSVALSDACWPEALIGAMPVIYPFIVNDPGEAAQAKRRIGAVTIGHVPPPLERTRTGAGLGRLEALLDEFSNADGLDPARRDRLQRDIRDEATAHRARRRRWASTTRDPQPTRSPASTRFVCDVKDSQYRRRPPRLRPRRARRRRTRRAARGARRAARRVRPVGLAVARPRRRAADRAQPLHHRSARGAVARRRMRKACKLADELIRRHLQDHGDYPRGLVVDLWGSATMRTAGEEFAMALHLLGAEPVWDMQSDRVTGVEILPLALLRPPAHRRHAARIRPVPRCLPDALRDVRPGRARPGARDEPADWNPFVGTPADARVYGPDPAATVSAWATPPKPTRRRRA